MHALTIEDHQYPVSAIAFSPDGLALATGDTERQVRVRRVDGALRQWSFQSKGAKVRSTERMRTLVFSPDSRYLHVSARDAIDSIWTDSGVEAWYYRPPRFLGFLVVSPLRISVSREGFVASSFDNGTVGVWTSDGNRCRIWHEKESPVWVGWLQDGNYLAGADAYHVQIWDWRLKMRTSRWTPGDKIVNFTVHTTESVGAVRTLYEVQVINLDEGKVLTAFEAPEGLPLLAFRPGHPELAVSGLDRVKVYNYVGQEVARYDLGGKRATSITWTHDGAALAVGCGDGSVKVFPVTEPSHELRLLCSYVSDGAFSI